jgi:hypothetical protein
MNWRLYWCKGVFWRKGIPTVSFLQLHDRPMSHMSFASLVIFASGYFVHPFSENQRFLPYKELVPWDAISVCIFSTLCVCVCVCVCWQFALISCNIRAPPFCLITARGVLQRQLAAGGSLFGSDIAIGPFACYLSRTMIRGGGSPLHGCCLGESSLLSRRLKHAHTVSANFKYLSSQSDCIWRRKFWFGEISAAVIKVTFIIAQGHTVSRFFMCITLLHTKLRNTVRLCLTSAP